MNSAHKVKQTLWALFQQRNCSDHIAVLSEKKAIRTEKVRIAFAFGDLAGNRTRDCAVRGRRLNRLTTRPSFKTLNDYIIKNMFLQLFFGVNSEFFCKNIDFSKEDIRLCRKTKKVNPLLAGGCAALPHQSFRFSTDLAYRKRLALPYILCGLRIVRIPYTAGVDLIISEYVQKCNREKEKNRDEICRAAVSSLRYWKKMKNQA